MKQITNSNYIGSIPLNVYNATLQYCNQVKEIMAECMKQVILFGSYARGDFHRDSDVDIMILTSYSSHEIDEIEKKIFDIAFDYLIDYDIEINPVLENINHYEFWKYDMPFFNNVRRDGVVIYG